MSGQPVQSVELLLDDTTDTLVRRQWQALADAGLPSQARHTGASNAPHVTLAVRTEIPQHYDDDLTAAVRTPPSLPLPLTLGGLLLFGTGRRVVLARAVIVTADLLEMHARIHSALAGTPTLDDRLAPGAWQPHVTLAHRLERSQLAEAVQALSGTSPDGASIEPTAPALSATQSTASAAQWTASELHGSAVEVRRWDAAARRTWLVS